MTRKSVRSLPAEQVRRLRMRAQRLVSRPESSAAAAVRDLCGVQAQEPAAAPLAVRARSTGLLAADVRRAREEERAIVRVWAMRYTLHLLAAEDVRWLLGLLGPHLVRTSQRRRDQLGLDERTSARAVRALREVLGRREPLTRAEIVEALAARGIRLDGQARPHLLGRAALDGLICLGPDRGTEPTYVLLDDWVNRGPALSGEDALAELARRYLSGYGPAGLEDLASWSGLPTADARTGLEAIGEELVEVAVAGRPAWLARSRAGWLDEPSAPDPVVRLLPAFDPYLLGYRDRSLIISAERERDVHPGGGVIRPALLVDGSLLGTWRTRRRSAGLLVEVRPFGSLTAEVRAAVAGEADDLGRFLGVPTTLRVAD